MSSIYKHRRDWRLLIWILLLISLLGPWFFDNLYIPSEYPCSVRLRENFCGSPVTGIWVFAAIFSVLGSSFYDLVRGIAVDYDAGRAFLISFLGISLVLPFFSTLLIIIRGDRRPQLAFHMIACSAAFGVGLMLGFTHQFKWFWRLWGVWLYVGSLASMLFLEVIALVERRRHSLGDAT